MELHVKSIAGINSELQIRVVGLTPGERLYLSIHAVDLRVQPWVNEQVFRANEAGVVDVATALPESALWSPADPFGVLWTMRPEGMAPDEGDGGAFELDGASPVHMRVKARTEDEGLGALLQRTIARSVVECVSPTGWVGFSPEKGGPAPGVVLLSDVPLPTGSASAAALAHHGFSVFSAADAHAVTAAQLAQTLEHPAVDSSRPLALVAHGRGCVPALRLAAENPELIGPVVAHSPSDVDFPHPGMSVFMKSKLTGHAADVHEFYDHAHDRAAALSVAGMTGPLLLSAGLSDRVWDSAAMSKELASRAEQAGIEVFRVTYDNAGHCCGYPFFFSGLPATMAIRVRGKRIATGGSADANGRAAQVSRQQVISYLASAFDIPINI